MIDITKLNKGDVIYHCCEYIWRAKYEFIQVLKDGRIKVKYLQDLGMYNKGEIEYLAENDLKYCYNDKQSAIDYQNRCKNKIKEKSNSELLKEIFNRADNAGIFTANESKLYRSMIYK